ncbi:MAG: DUF4364 family protein [Bacillota bacterium]|nr:DUF4364 family protein [Bacillota bacterium]
MFEDTMELAENKLLLLYILQQIKIPVSKNQITDVVLQNNFINYFTLQQYISELINSNFVQYIEKEGKRRLLLTEKGNRVLDMFISRISESKKGTIDEYLMKNLNNIKKAVSVTADYTIENNNSFMVNLRASENDTILIDININVVSNKQARELCNKWKNNSSELYTKIIQLLTKD